MVGSKSMHKTKNNWKLKKIKVSYAIVPKRHKCFLIYISKYVQDLYTEILMKKIREENYKYNYLIPRLK